MQHEDPHSEPLIVAGNDERGPVFITGIMPRSGTNFLHRLICQHPACGAINETPVREDYLLHHAGLLWEYIGRLRWQWGHWGADGEFVEPLARSAGMGLTVFLDRLTKDGRVVTKTPSVAHIDLFDRFFAHAYLLIIVRDGRSVVASGMSGFGWNFETATREWVRAARIVLNFRKKPAKAGRRFRVVQYEALNEQTPGELEAILRFLNLDVDAYDFEAAMETPVYGSSYHKDGNDEVTWDPQQKSDRFESNERWKSWSKAQHERFNWLAGREMNEFGYELEYAHRRPGKLKHTLLDLLYGARRAPGRLYRAARVGLRVFLEALKIKQGQKVNLKR